MWNLEIPEEKAKELYRVWLGRNVLWKCTSVQIPVAFISWTEHLLGLKEAQLSLRD